MNQRHGRRLAAIAVTSTVAVGTALFTASFAQAAGPVIHRVSVGSHGGQANNTSFNPAITPNGRFVAFESDAGNLVRGDRNNNRDVFVRDTWNGSTRRVSVALGGGDANGSSDDAAISADGRYVAFESSASNLVASDANGAEDVFVRDLKTGVTTRVSVGLSNAAGSGGGSFPSISANGQRIAFQSQVSDLVPNDTNGSMDVFVWKAATKRITRVSVGPNGIQSDLPPVPRPAYGGERESFDAAISGDGRSVAFASTATNLVTGDTNGVGDIFVHNLRTSVTRRVSLTSAGEQVTTGNRGSGSFSPSISHDGKVVAFVSNSFTLVPNASHLHQLDSYVVNLNTGVMRRVEKAFDGAETARGAESPSVSPDGRFVLFSSSDANVVSGDTNAKSDVFVRDLRTGRTRLVSVGRHGAQADGDSGSPVASSGAAVIAFGSTATNLVANDTNGVNDIFTRG